MVLGSRFCFRICGCVFVCVPCSPWKRQFALMFYRSILLRYIVFLVRVTRYIYWLLENALLMESWWVHKILVFFLYICNDPQAAGAIEKYFGIAESSLIWDPTDGALYWEMPLPKFFSSIWIGKAHVNVKSFNNLFYSMQKTPKNKSRFDIFMSTRKRPVTSSTI